MTPWTDMTAEEREAFKQTDAYLDPTNPARVPWGEWSVEASKELLWAAHRGSRVQFCMERPWHVWKDVSPVWNDYITYRIPPEPKRETVQLKGYRYGSKKWTFGVIAAKADTHSITFETIDGEPDLSSIKMEKLQ